MQLNKVFGSLAMGAVGAATGYTLHPSFASAALLGVLGAGCGLWAQDSVGKSKSKTPREYNSSNFIGYDHKLDIRLEGQVTPDCSGNPSCDPN